MWDELVGVVIKTIQPILLNDPSSPVEQKNPSSPVESPARKKKKKKETGNKDQSKTVLKQVGGGTTRNYLTWRDRVSSIFLVFHPDIYGNQELSARVKLGAQACGVSSNTFRQWISVRDKGCAKFIQIWHPLLMELTWGDVKKNLKKEFQEQYMHIDDSSDAKERLSSYKHATQSECIIITSKTKGTNAKCRVVRSKKNRGVKYIVLGQNKNATKSSERKDKLTARKWKEQNKCVEVFVQSWWNQVDPCTREEVYGMVHMRDDCAEGTGFYLKKLASGKESGLAKFLSDALDRFHFSVRKNSIGQTVPENWRELVEKNSADLNKLFVEGKVDVVINADPKFVNFLPEAQYVLAPKGAKRIGGKIK